MPSISENLKEINDWIIQWVGLNGRNILVNGSMGAAAGYLTMRFAKVVAITMGITIIFMQVLDEFGVIDLNWEATLHEARLRFDNLLGNYHLYPVSILPEQGFLGGFLIGMSLV